MVQVKTVKFLFGGGARVPCFFGEGPGGVFLLERGLQPMRSSGQGLRGH